MRATCDLDQCCFPSFPSAGYVRRPCVLFCCLCFASDLALSNSQAGSKICAKKSNIAFVYKTLYFNGLIVGLRNEEIPDVP